MTVKYDYDCATCGVSGMDYKIKLCSRCKKVKYCTRPCQKEDWRHHRNAECVPLDVQKETACARIDSFVVRVRGGLDTDPELHRVIYGSGDLLVSMAQTLPMRLESCPDTLRRTVRMA